MSRLPLRFAVLIVLFFSFLLFFSGWILQQRSLNAMQEAINPGFAAKNKKIAVPKPLISSKPGPHLLQHQADGAMPGSLSRGVGGKTGKKAAYVQYVMEKHQLCNSIMILAELDRLGTVADKVLLYPHSWVADERGTWNRLLKVAEQRYGVIVRAADPLVEAEGAPAISLLHLFAETKYARVLHLDSSGMVLRNLDELLFSAPPSPVAGTRAYWRSQAQQAEAPLSGHLLLIEPSQDELARVIAFREKHADASPMQLVNRLYAAHALILPQHPYDTRIAEFRSEAHERYVLGGAKDTWDPAKIREQSYYVHFGDVETPMPWHILPREIEERVRPKRPDDWKVWKALYNRWAGQRMDVCGLDLEPVPVGFR